MTNLTHHHLISSFNIQNQEYSARYGLKHALNNLAEAQQIAEAKYRTLVGRDVLISEMSDIKELIEELHEWVAITKPHENVTCTH